MKKSFLLVSHGSVKNSGGPVHKLTEYLKQKFAVNSIIHPLYPYSNFKSRIIFQNKQLEFKINPFIQYISEGAISSMKLFLLRFKPVHIDVVICFDPLSFIDIYLFRFIIKYKTIVYYNMDFSINRFSNPLLNIIYKKINIFAYKKCTYFYYLSDHSLKVLDPDNKYLNKSFLVKHSTKNIRLTKLKRGNIIVYAGTISRTVDFTNVFKALVILKKDQVEFILHIYGKENDSGVLRSLIKKYNLSRQVKFKGSVNMDELLIKVFPICKVGIATYKIRGVGLPDYMFQGVDLTAKIVDYISCGVPIVSTRLTPAFDVIEKKKFGFLVDSVDQWHYSLKTLLKNENTFNKYSLNAKKYSLKYSESNIFDPIINQII